MRRFGSSNVVFKKMRDREFDNVTELASYKGVGVKLLLFAVFVLLGAALGIGLLYVNPGMLGVTLAISGILTFILALVSMSSNKACKITGPLYCLFEGCTIGVVSLAVSTVLEGAVTMALLSTICVFAVCALLYIFNVVQVTSGFMKFLLMLSLGFIFSQLVFLIVSLFTDLEYSFGLVTLISFVSVFIATLYLFFDMQNIKMVVEGGYPKDYEWTASFGLAFTLIWLYIEILRLVVIIAGRDN